MTKVEEIKAAVRDRDGHRCIDCGRHESTLKDERLSYNPILRLDVHRKIAEGEYSLENCETLCRSCHNQRRRDYRFIGVVNGRKRFARTPFGAELQRVWEERRQQAIADGRCIYTFWRVRERFVKLSLASGEIVLPTPEEYKLPARKAQKLATAS